MSDNEEMRDSYLLVNSIDGFGVNKPSDMTFTLEEKEVIKLCSNGDIYVKGKLIENDKELVTGLREWLTGVRKEAK